MQREPAEIPSPPIVGGGMVRTTVLDQGGKKKTKNEKQNEKLEVAICDFKTRIDSFKVAKWHFKREVR